ncbi:MAG: hypothetical protein ACK476_16030 [Fluviicola sp.]|jgi:hypothetical protein
MRLKSWHYVALGLFIAISVHLIEQIVYSLPFGLHSTADDPSYYQPAFNFLYGNGWKDNSIGESSFVARPPLMGFIYLIGKILVNKYVFTFIYILALIFHACAIYQFHKRISVVLSPFYQKLTIAIFIALPCFWGFLSYGITEAFSCSFVLLSFALIVTKSEKKRIYYLIGIIAFFLLFRPVLILLFIPILIHSLFNLRNQISEKISVKLKVIVLSLVFIASIWQIRVYKHVNEFSFHPIYHESNVSEFRKPHQALGELFKIWEYRPEYVHFWVGKCRTNLKITQDEIQHYCSDSKVPIRAKKLHELLLKLQISYKELQFIYIQKQQVSETKFEKELTQQIELETKKLREHYRFQNMIQTPLLSAKYMFTKSQLNLGIFQEKWRGTFWVEALRYFCVFILISSVIAVFLSVFNSNGHLKLVALGIVLFYFYLVYFQRLNEDRYLIPVQGISLLFLFLQLEKIITFLKKKGTFISKFRK